MNKSYIWLGINISLVLLVVNSLNCNAQLKMKINSATFFDFERRIANVNGELVEVNILSDSKYYFNINTSLKNKYTDTIYVDLSSFILKIDGNSLHLTNCYNSAETEIRNDTFFIPPKSKINLIFYSESLDYYIPMKETSMFEDFYNNFEVYIALLNEKSFLEFKYFYRQEYFFTIPVKKFRSINKEKQLRKFTLKNKCFNKT